MTCTSSTTGRPRSKPRRREPPQVGFLDIGMPGLNGYELARRLRQQDATRDMLLVAVSGWGQQSDRARSRESGFDHHLIKPVELQQVLDVLREPAALR